MKIKNTIICKKLLSELKIANEENRRKKLSENNFIKIQDNGTSTVLVTLLVNNKQVMTLNKNLFKNIFNYRDNYIAVVDKDSITVITNVRLHGHTGYSILDGTVKINQLVKKTEYSCAITDHGVLYGAISFYKEMKKNHKNPIIGFEAYTEDIDGNPAKHHLILLAKNTKGWENISLLSSLGHTNMGGKFPKRPLLKYEWLRKYNEGVVCLSACLGGEIPQTILKGKDVKKIVNNFLEIYGEDFYLEIQRHNIDVEKEVNSKILELGKEFGIKVVATDDAHYLNEEDKEIHEIHLCNQTQKTMSDPKRYRFEGDGYFVHTTEQMEEKFKDIPEVLFNTLEVMDKCNFSFDFGNYKLPKFPLPNGFTEEEYFEKVSREGFEKRFPKGSKQNSSKEYRDRLEYEIGIIKKMGYCAYFLIVWDFVNYAKNNGIPVGPGRGSACGSLVAYSLAITNIDPIPYDLLFERFLNPDRVSMPDIDMDFGDLKREQVIDYCRKTYGKECVSRIITFGTLAAKVAVRDVARIVYDSPEDKGLGDKISKLIPEAPKMTLDKALDLSVELKNLYDANKKVKDIIDKAKRLEGLPKNLSIHACGVVISDRAITNYCPQVYIEDKETGKINPTTQFTMGEIEELGLLKMDVRNVKC